MKNDNKLKYTLIAVCAVVFAVMAMVIPDFFGYDIGYKNEQLAQTVTDQPIAEDVLATEFNLPVLYIKCDTTAELFDVTLVPRAEVKADIYVLNRESNRITDRPVHVYKDVTLTLRGNSSALYQEKKSFNLEFSDAEGNSLDLPFLNMEPESDFVLYAPYLDRSLIRNYLGYTLQAQVQDWAPDCAFVEVFIDTPGTDLSFKDYVGVYMVTEKFKKGVNRINTGNFTIADNPAYQFEQGGGYIYKMDWYDSELDNVTRLEKNKHGNEYSVVYPKPQNMTEEAEQVIFDEIELYEDALYNGTDEELAKYFDLEQIARNMLVSEFLKCHEAYSASTFFYREVGGKIKVVQWDFDLGTGNIRTEADMAPSRDKFWVLGYWPMPQVFLQHKNFQQIIIEQWESLRRGVLSEENIINMLDELEVLLDGAWQRNDTAYPNAFNSGQFAIWDWGMKSSQEERQFVKDYLIERGRWLDEHIYELAD